ncbi:RasGAP protein [Coemansia sp. RSA 1085]|nr:RasGAP protein [Coemansia sp. RSA 1085]
MPVRKNDTALESTTEQDTGSKGRRHRQGRGRRQSTQSKKYEENSTTSWLGRLWSGIRRLRESGSSAAVSAKTVVESGTAAVGSVRNPSVAIPADIMFSPQRAALYSTMTTQLVRNPYYISRIVHQVKYHECDALLNIIFNSLFGDSTHEPALIALFKEIIEMEVDRTESIDTLMRNDAPSLYVLSTYMSKACLDYLQIAVRPTIEVIMQLGHISLDPDLASAYQDWAHTQKNLRLPLVVSAVEAASYTEVQNLSRRRHRHLVHVATHCLFDIISSRHHIPAGLVAICTSTLQATRRKFPHIDATKGYSLVGGMFFLRFINAALTTPNQYGLMSHPPTGTEKSNLKLVARLMQRLSNNSAKLPEEWPLDARKFMKANVEKFHSFVSTLTSGQADVDEDTAALASRRVQSAGTLAVSVETSSKALEADTAQEPSTREAKSMDSRDMPADAQEVPAYRTKSTSWAKQPKGTRVRRIIGGTRACAAGCRAQQVAPLSHSLNAPGNEQAPKPAVNGERESSTSTESSLGDCSIRSMFNMGQMLVDSQDESGRRPSRNGAYGDVVLPLNDLYLLQKYLLLYEHAWLSEEPVKGGKSAVPMKDCLKKLGPAPAPVKSSNNHKTRIPLE